MVRKLYHGRFTRKMQALDTFSNHGRADRGNSDEYDELGAEYDDPAPPEICEIGRKEVAVWKIAIVGNGLLAALLTFLHCDLTHLLITPLGPIQEVPPEYREFSAVLYSNANILALTGMFFSIAVYVRRTLSDHDNIALHAVYLIVLIIPLGACVTIDFFVSGLVEGGVQVSATRFALLVLIFSAVAYGLGWLCFLPYILKHSTLPPSDNKSENIEDEDAEKSGLNVTL